MDEVIKLLETALHLLREEQLEPTPTETEESIPLSQDEIAWGAKVSPLFRERVRWICNALRMSPDDLMSCMAWESGETFSPSVTNMAGSGATGLIQFMPSTAVSLGTTTRKLAAMSAEDQLNFVYKYFRPFAGRLNNLGDIYMAILWPRAVGKPDSYVLWDRARMPTTFRQNAGLDTNKNGQVTRAECLKKIQSKLTKGRLPNNMA